MLNHITMKIFKNIPETNCPRTNVQVVEPFCVGGFLFMETWKDIENYKGHYQISNLGRVKSIKKEQHKILSQGLCGSGYLVVALCLNSISKTKMVHRLVAESFLGCNSDMQVNHIDENKLNNNLSNLEYVSGRVNIQKYYSTRVNTNKKVGATFNKATNKWRSFIRVNGKQVYLGAFVNELEAAKAYQEAIKKYDYATNS